MRAVAALAVASIVAMPGVVQAQSADRFRVSINGGTQVGSRTVAQNFDVTVNLEPAPIVNTIDLSNGGLFDLGASYHLAAGLWAGVSFSSLSRSTDGAVTAKIPHPFLFNQPRSVSGTVDGLKSKERDIHISAIYLVPLSKTFEVALFGGPTRFDLKQDLITDVAFADAYPYDTAVFTSAPATTVAGSVWGFHVGADLTWRLSQRFGVGGLIRYAKGSTTLTADPGNAVTFDAGGTQVGGGLRVIF